MKDIRQDRPKPAHGLPPALQVGWDGAVRFDAYTATSTQTTPADLVDLVRWEGDTVQDGLTGYHRFGERLVIKDRGDNPVAAILWGGEHGSRVMLEVKGTRTGDAVQAIRTAQIGHRCTRVDSCIDFDHPDAFDRLLAPLVALKRKKNLWGEHRGDWDQPELGRTQYLGAPTSAVRARLYEKGKQPEERHRCRSDWVRLELQVRPQDDKAKAMFAAAAPLDVWGASTWSRELASQILLTAVTPLKAEAAKPQSVDERKLLWMCRQYSQPLASLLLDVGGDLAEFGARINTHLATVQTERDYFSSRKATAKDRNQ